MLLVHQLIQPPISSLSVGGKCPKTANFSRSLGLSNIHFYQALNSLCVEHNQDFMDT